MSRQEDFDTQSNKYVEMRKSFGVNDPYALNEIGEAHYQGAEYGYQYAVDKACKYFMRIKECDLYEDKESQAKAVDDFINRFRKAMQ